MWSMTKALAEIARASAELSVQEKLELAGMLLDTAEMPNGSSSEIEAAWEAEIQRRIDEIHSGKAKGIPLSETKRKIEKLLTK